MNITQTLTAAVIAILVTGYAIGDDPRPTSAAAARRIAPRSAPSQYQFEKQKSVPSIPPGIEIAQADKPDVVSKGDPQAREVLLAAGDKLKSYASVRASITEKVSIQTNSFTARGSYLQGQNLQLRMEFTVELGGQKGSLLEVCDGQVLWTRHDLGDKDQTQITRRDVRQILAAAEKAETQFKSAEERSGFQTSLIADLGIGGLPALLAAFAKDYDFKPATEARIDDRDVVVIEGTWNSKYREMWLGPKSKDKTPPPLPVYVPDLARLSFDKETLFPRRIEFLKKIPGESVPSPLMTVDFTKVVFNGKVARDDFVFIPPERPAPVDITQVYLQRLAPPKKDSKSPPAAPSAEKADAP